MWPFGRDPGKWRRISGMENPENMTLLEQVCAETEAEEVWAQGGRWFEIAPAGLVYRAGRRSRCFPWEMVTALRPGVVEFGWGVRCTFDCPIVNPKGFEPPLPEQTAKDYFAALDEAFRRNRNALPQEQLEHGLAVFEQFAREVRAEFPELCPYVFAPFRDWLR